jgi:uncharacterized membrane protein HdeD (DUF308 family)
MKRRRRRLEIPWWGLLAAGGVSLLVGLLVICIVAMTYLVVTEHQEFLVPGWLGILCMGPGVFLLTAGVLPAIYAGGKLARRALQREWVSSHDLREEYRQPED